MEMSEYGGLGQQGAIVLIYFSVSLDSSLVEVFAKSPHSKRSHYIPTTACNYPSYDLSLQNCFCLSAMEWRVSVFLGQSSRTWADLCPFQSQLAANGDIICK